MFALGILIGIYGYSIFLLGLLGLLYAPFIWVISISFVAGTLFYYRKTMQAFRVQEIFQRQKSDIFFPLLLLLLFLQIVINAVGVLGPELGFDALWYHLTLPKIYLLSHSITFIPGGLLYYSTMPKFLELLYAGALSFGSSALPKFIHFGFGILTLIVLYKIARRFFSKKITLLVLLVFYSSLVVGWESISAYIDLGRTFFELLSFLAFLQWMEAKHKKWLIYSAIFMGLSITTKILALGSLLLMTILIGVELWNGKQNHKAFWKTITSYVGIATLIPLPWIVFSFANTGNLFYPFFTHTYPLAIPYELINPIYFVSSFWNLFLYAADPLNPFYLMGLPLIFLFVRKWPRELQYIFLFSIGGLLLWYVTPRSGGGRFVLPYLPLLSVVSVAGMMSLSQKKLKQFLFIVIIIISLISISYRAIANAKFLPVILGRESEISFLTSHLNFSFGDFVDSDFYFTTHIKPTDTVLLYGFHNLYYVEFPFIDSSWVKRGDVFTYIATQHTELPKRFSHWTLIYTNPVTHVLLYSAGGIPWTY